MSVRARLPAIERVTMSPTIYSAGVREERDLFVRLVDSQSRQVSECE